MSSPRASSGAGPIRVAVVGLGWVATHRHIPQILRNRDFRLEGVIDRRPGRAREVAAGLRDLRWAETSHLQDVDWLDAVDAVVIAAAPAAHHGLATSALSLRKHVLLEKPFAMSVGEGQQIVAAAEAASRKLAVVHNFQFSSAMRSLLGDLEHGRLGEVRGVNGVQFGNPARRLPSWYEELPLGLFYDESPHLLYLLDRVATTPLSVTRVESIPSTTGHVTPAQVNVTFFESGGDRPYTLRCNFEAPVSEWFLVVHGERALGIADVFRDIYLRLPNDGGHTAWPVLRTSLTATWQHWRQVLSQGARHVTGRLYYGNDEVYHRFGDAILREPARLRPIGPDRAQHVLELQHEIIGAAR